MLNCKMEPSVCELPQTGQSPVQKPAASPLAVPEQIQIESEHAEQQRPTEHSGEKSEAMFSSDKSLDEMKESVPDQFQESSKIVWPEKSSESFSESTKTESNDVVSSSDNNVASVSEQNVVKDDVTTEIVDNLNNVDNNEKVHEDVQVASKDSVEDVVDIPTYSPPKPMERENGRE